MSHCLSLLSGLNRAARPGLTSGKCCCVQAPAMAHDLKTCDCPVFVLFMEPRCCKRNCMNSDAGVVFETATVFL